MLFYAIDGVNLAGKLQRSKGKEIRGASLNGKRHKVFIFLLFNSTRFLFPYFFEKRVTSRLSCRRQTQHKSNRKVWTKEEPQGLPVCVRFKKQSLFFIFLPFRFVYSALEIFYCLFFYLCFALCVIQ